MEKTNNLQKCFELLDHESKRVKKFHINSNNIEFFSLFRVAKKKYTFFVFKPEDALAYDIILSGSLYNDSKFVRSISEEKLVSSFSEEALENLRENRLMFVYYTNRRRYFIIPTKEFMATFVKTLNGSGKIFRDVTSFNRDIFLAEAMSIYNENDCMNYNNIFMDNNDPYDTENDTNTQMVFISKGSGVAYKALCCVSEMYNVVNQNVIKEIYPALKANGAEFLTCSVSDAVSFITFVYNDQRIGNYVPGIQFVFSDSADSSTIVRKIIYAGNESLGLLSKTSQNNVDYQKSIIYLDGKSFNHKKLVTGNVLLSAVDELMKKGNEKNIVKKLEDLKKAKCESNKDAYALFKSLCVSAKLRSAVGSRKAEEVYAETEQYFLSLEKTDGTAVFRPSKWSYADILAEFIGVLTRFPHTDSTAERSRKMMLSGIDYLCNTEPVKKKKRGRKPKKKNEKKNS